MCVQQRDTRLQRTSRDKNKYGRFVFNVFYGCGSNFLRPLLLPPFFLFVVFICLFIRYTRFENSNTFRTTVVLTVRSLTCLWANIIPFRLKCTFGYYSFDVYICIYGDFNRFSAFLAISVIFSFIFEKTNISLLLLHIQMKHLNRVVFNVPVNHHMIHMYIYRFILIKKLLKNSEIMRESGV